MSPQLAATRWPFFLEKWYIDTLLPDGTVLLVYLGRIVAFQLSLARVTAELFRPGQVVVRGHAPARGISSDASALRFGPATVEGETLRWTTRGLSGELRFTPRHPPVTLRSPFIRHGRRTLEWHIEVPDADVRGIVRWLGGELAVEGRGYRDHVWFDILPWAFPLRQLRWGRAVSASSAMAWVEAESRTGRVSERWADGIRQPDPVASDAHARLAMTDERVLLETAVTDIEGLGLRCRPLLRRLFRHPTETKWAALATLDGQPGRAIHEVVRWI